MIYYNELKTSNLIISNNSSPPWTFWLDKRRIDVQMSPGRLCRQRK